MSLHKELIANLEALASWASATPAVNVHASFVRRGVATPFATVMPIAAPQFNSTGGAHPTFKHAGMRITVYSTTQLQASTLCEAAYEHLRDFSGNLIDAGGWSVASADAPESPADDMIEPQDASDSPLFSTSFLVNFIYQEA